MAQKFLVKKDVVDIVSPSTACASQEFKKIKNFLEKIDLKPRIFFEKELSLSKPATNEFASFAPKMRFEQFKSAVNSDSKIIWCARGGYGSAEILSFLEEMPKPKIQKIFIGFSDISSLNNFLIEKWNWQVLSAPMLAQIALEKVSKKSILAICDFIFGKKTELKYSLKLLASDAKNTIEAKITGGCLSVLAAQFGTKNQLNWQDKILFLEDEGESGERLDRYFNQLIEIFLEKKLLPKAIILGNFLETNAHGAPKARNIKIALEKFAKKLTEKKINIALFEEKTKCLGHSKNMLPLILGAKAKISVNGILMQKF
jgi:muramoyltetrapeptide carboxypeptidase